MENNNLYCYKYTWNSLYKRFSIQKCDLKKAKEYMTRYNAMHIIYIKQNMCRYLDFGVVYNTGIVYLENRDDEKARKLLIENGKNRLKEMNKTIKNIKSNIKLLETINVDDETK